MSSELSLSMAALLAMSGLTTTDKYSRLHTTLPNFSGSFNGSLWSSFFKYPGSMGDLTSFVSLIPVVFCSSSISFCRWILYLRSFRKTYMPRKWRTSPRQISSNFLPITFCNSSSSDGATGISSTHTSRNTLVAPLFLTCIHGSELDCLNPSIVTVSYRRLFQQRADWRRP